MNLYKIPENTDYLIVRESTSVMAWEDWAKEESSKVGKCLVMMNIFYVIQ